MVVKFWVGAKLAFKKASRALKKKNHIHPRTVISNTFIVNFATGIEIITRFLSWTTGPPYSTVLTVSYPNTLQLFPKKKKLSIKYINKVPIFFQEMQVM